MDAINCWWTKWCADWVVDINYLTVCYFNPCAQ